jgi:hypothetical protein
VPTVTIPQTNISRDDAMEAVRQQLGADYKVKAGGNAEVFSVEKGTLSGAKVHMKSEGGATKFHVHGTGIIIGRIVNELGIARKVATAIGQTSLGQGS